MLMLTHDPPFLFYEDSVCASLDDRFYPAFWYPVTTESRVWIKAIFARGQSPNDRRDFIVMGGAPGYHLPPGLVAGLHYSCFSVLFHHTAVPVMHCLIAHYSAHDLHNAAQRALRFMGLNLDVQLESHYDAFNQALDKSVRMEWGDQTAYQACFGATNVGRLTTMCLYVRLKPLAYMRHMTADPTRQVHAALERAGWD